MEKAVFYRCGKCGNVVAKLVNGGGTLTCCGEEMTALKANSTDAAQEKHVPVAVRGNGKIRVTVGSVNHPMMEEHFIEWIALVTDKDLQIVHLKPGDVPKAEFTDSEKAAEVYAFCNLHGLWRADV